MLTITPTQREQHEAHKARRSRFAKRAKSNIEAQLKAIEQQRYAEEQKAIAQAAAIELQRKFYRDAWKVIDGPGRIDRAQNACAKYFNVTRSDILSARRTADIVKPRQIAMWLAKETTKRSLPEIGRRFGNRDHTTVLHAVRKIAHLKQHDARIAEDIANIYKIMESDND